MIGITFENIYEENSVGFGELTAEFYVCSNEDCKDKGYILPTFKWCPYCGAQLSWPIRLLTKYNKSVRSNTTKYTATT